MLRIGIIGNSHMAALMHGVAGLSEAEKSSVQVKFFGAPGKSLEYIEVQSDRLVAQNSKVKQSLETVNPDMIEFRPDDFDAVIVVGLRFWLPLLQPNLSDAVKYRSCKRAVQNTLTWRIAQLVRSISQVPLFLMHVPLEAIPEKERPLDAFVPYPEVLDLISAHVEDLGAVVVMSQPQITRQGLFTDPVFSKGSRRLLKDVGHATKDKIHMNADFGAIVIQHLLNTVQDHCASSRGEVARDTVVGGLCLTSALAEQN
jgi:hypothetical protein